MNSENYINSLLDKNKRVDGRGLMEYRKPIKIETGISKNAEGSARVTIGETEVVAGVKLDVGEPYPDNPDEGTIIVNAELLPLSSPEFESGPPDAQTVELARIVDRGIRESQMIDFKKLCVKEGEKAWLVFIDVYTINDAGNLIDASALAAIAALKEARFPKYDKKEEKAVYGELTSEKLPLKKILPMTCTLVKVGKSIIVDPCVAEEKAMDARLTVTISEEGNIHAMQKGGDKSLSLEDIEKMIGIAAEKTKELRGLLK